MLFPLEKLGGGRERTQDTSILGLSLALSPRMSTEQANSMALNRHAMARLTVLGIGSHMYKIRN